MLRDSRSRRKCTSKWWHSNGTIWSRIRGRYSQLTGFLDLELKMQINLVNWLYIFIKLNVYFHCYIPPRHLHRPRPRRPRRSPSHSLPRPPRRCRPGPLSAWTTGSGRLCRSSSRQTCPCHPGSTRCCRLQSVASWSEPAPNSSSRTWVSKHAHDPPSLNLPNLRSSSIAVFTALPQRSAADAQSLILRTCS